MWDLVQHTPMFIGWLTCIPAVLLPHSLCRSTTANAPANRKPPNAHSLDMLAAILKGISVEEIRIKSEELCKEIFEN